MRVTRHHSCRVSPFGHPRINARLAAPRGLSQPPTSFIGSQCQGIHHAPLNTYKHKTNIRNCTSANNNQHPHTPPERETRRRHGHCSLDARNHYPRIKHHTPHHQRWSDNNPPPKGGATTPGSPKLQRPKKYGTEVAGLLSQSPIVCLAIPSPAKPRAGKTFVVHQNRHPLQARPIQRIAQLTELPQAWAGHKSRGAP